MIIAYTGASLARNLTPQDADLLGMLSDALSCTVTRDTDGGFDLSMTYPVQGSNAKSLALNNWLYCPVGGSLGPQYFRIDQVSQSIDGVVTVHASHSTYNSLAIVATAFTAGNRTQVGYWAWYQALLTAINTVDTTQMGSFLVSGFTDELPVNGVAYEAPVSLKQAVLDAIKDRDIILLYDNFSLRLWKATALGSSPAFRIRYGRDMLTYDTSADSTDFYTHVFPYYVTSDGELVTHGNDIYPLENLPSEYQSYRRIQAVNLADYYDDLTYRVDGAIVQSIIDDWLDAHPWNPFPQEISVSQIPQDKNSFELGNAGNLYYDPTGTVISANIVSLTYDVLADRITDIGINRRIKDITDTIAGLARG